MRMSVGLRAPPPATIQARGAAGKCGTMRATDAAVSADNVAAPSTTEKSGRPILAKAKALRSSDFGYGRAKKPSSSTRVDEGLVDAALRRLVAIAVERRAGARAHEIVDQRIAGAGIAGDRIAAVDKSDIGDAADIEHGDRMRPIEIARQRLMKDRHQRRALAAGGHIGGAEIMNHGHVQPPRQRRAVAELHGQPRRRLVQHGLAVEADNRDGRLVDPLGGEKVLHRLGMHAGHEGVGFGQHARPRRAVGQGGALVQRLPQQGLLGIRIGPVAGRPECGDALAIGLDQRHIDAIERGPAHQPDRPYRRPNPNPFSFTPDLLHHRPKHPTSRVQSPINERL